jgi:hypothetical protein
MLCLARTIRQRRMACPDPKRTGLRGLPGSGRAGKGLAQLRLSAQLTSRCKCSMHGIAELSLFRSPKESRNNYLPICWPEGS